MNRLIDLYGYPIQPFDRVALKAGGDPFRVLRVVISCDGTGGDGAGLYCRWFENGDVYEGWVSESSIVRVDHAFDN